MRTTVVLCTDAAPVVVTVLDEPMRDFSPYGLVEAGRDRVELFCRLNNIPVPTINVVASKDWHVAACAYYRPDTDKVRKWTKSGINICVSRCAKVATEDGNKRLWSYPGSVTDREPYGVICHELGHHCDWLTGEKKWTYGSEYSEQVMKESGEKPITSYCPNSAEWFAECFRLFVTNPSLLREIRPKTYEILRRKWRTATDKDWRQVLGEDVPPRVLKSVCNKMLSVEPWSSVGFY